MRGKGQFVGRAEPKNQRGVGAGAAVELVLPGRWKGHGRWKDQLMPSRPSEQGVAGGGAGEAFAGGAHSRLPMAQGKWGRVSTC